MIKSLFLLLASAWLFTACKKGEDDPFLSLKSRDARLRGEWKLVKAYALDFDGTEGMFDGHFYTVTQSGNIVDQYVFDLAYTFEKGGKSKLVTIKNEESYSIEGLWSWQNTNKKKTTLSVIYDTFHVKRLSGKELVLTQEKTTTVNGQPFMGSVTLTFEKQ